MKSRIQIMTLLLGIALGSAGMYFLTPPPVSAQMMSPMPMSSGSMHGMQMSPAQCAAMHNAMMNKMHSPADRSMMDSMLGMQHSMANATITGNADHDFLEMMIPHHQAAVQMAKAELQYGKDPKVRALAEQIISSQEKEIAEMSSWLK